MTLSTGSEPPRALPHMIVREGNVVQNGWKVTAEDGLSGWGRTPEDAQRAYTRMVERRRSDAH